MPESAEPRPVVNGACRLVNMFLAGNFLSLKSVPKGLFGILADQAGEPLTRGFKVLSRREILVMLLVGPAILDQLLELQPGEVLLRTRLNLNYPVKMVLSKLSHLGVPQVFFEE